MKVFKKIIAGTLAIAAVFSFAACGETESGSGAANSTKSGSTAKDQTTGSSTAKDDLKKVRIGICGADGTEALVESLALAYKLGYLEEELNKDGYTAEFYGFAQAGPAINEAFAAGEIDVGFYADFPLITAISNGVDISGFVLTNSEMNFAVFARKDSGIESVNDLNGKNVIVGAGTILQKYFLDVVDKYSLDLKSINQINSLSDAQSLIASGNADAVIYNYQAALLLEANGLGKVIQNSTDFPEYSSAVVGAAGNEWLKENKSAASAIIRALSRAQEYAAENPKDVYDKFATDTTPASIFEKVYSYDESFEYFKPEITDEYLKRAQTVADFMYENGLTKSKVDVNNAFDTSYVKEALSQ